MIDSYLMMDPRGTIMTNTNNKQEYKKLEDVPDDFEGAVNSKKYRKRGAVYNWFARRNKK
jgi:hypothetical protein